MIIQLKKFGETLISRQAGREALLAFQPTLRNISQTEKIEIDFSGIITLAPSWADEFITGLKKHFGQRVIFVKSANPSVIATLEILAENSRI